MYSSLPPSWNKACHERQKYLRVFEGLERFQTHVGILVTILLTQETLPVVSDAWRGRELWAIILI